MTKIDLNMAEMMKMSDQVGADDGPGSSAWNESGTVTQQINEAVIEDLRANRGKLSGELGEFPLILITTTGAKTGKRRTIPLAYQLLENRLVIIASMAGSVRNPPWYHNLVANPEVDVELDGETFRARAEVTQGKDRDALFEGVCANLPMFRGYEQRTERTIPVIELKRV